MALQRFSDRRGSPTIVYSDNDTNLTAGDKELQECLQRLSQESIGSTLARKDRVAFFTCCSTLRRCLGEANQDGEAITQSRPSRPHNN